MESSTVVNFNCQPQRTTFSFDIYKVEESVDTEIESSSKVMSGTGIHVLL